MLGPINLAWFRSLNSEDYGVLQLRGWLRPGALTWCFRSHERRSEGRMPSCLNPLASPACFVASPWDLLSACPDAGPTRVTRPGRGSWKKRAWHGSGDRALFAGRIGQGTSRAGGPGANGPPGGVRPLEIGAAEPLGSSFSGHLSSFEWAALWRRLLLTQRPPIVWWRGSWEKVEACGYMGLC